MNEQSKIVDLKGVGDKTEQRLLLRFGSVSRIASASMEELSDAVGPQLARVIHEVLNTKES